MRISESFYNSLGSLLHNKMRSLLTMLGIIIGVTSVILLTSIGQGVKDEVTSQVESLGSNLLYVMPGKIDIKNGSQSESKLGIKMGAFGHTKSTLTYEDVLDLKSNLSTSHITGYYSGVDKLDNLNILVTTTGVDEDLLLINKLNLKYGRFITKEEREKKQKVAVIGYQANKELFNNKNSIGETFKLNGNNYRVVGVLAYKKTENMGPQSEDFNTKIYLPITELLGRSKDKNISLITVNAPSSQDVGRLEKIIKDVLNKHHPEGDFSVLKQQDILDTVNKILGILNAALGGIAAISLIVGGIGIMNIMLASVTERTREIGLRKAIGARFIDILSQFLIESITLSIFGATIGLGLGVVGAQSIPKAFPLIPSAVSTPAVLISLGFALFIGVFFGVYPAIKAARLNPIEALRCE